MYKFAFNVCLVFFLAATSFSQDSLLQVRPETQGFSSQKLARIDNMVKEYIDQGKVAGTAYLVARNGKIVLYRSLGYDDREARTPLKRNAIFRIASQTKAITSVAVMMLYEEGKFLLDDPVSRYIHSFKNPQVLDKFNEKDTTYTTVPAKKEITIRHLLTHTSGIGYAQIGSKEARAIYAKNKIFAGLNTSRTSLAQDIQLLGSLPLMHQPGEKFTYGLNTDVLGYLVELMSGLSLEEFFRKRIFDPLGMHDTYFNVPSSKHNRVATAYMPDSTGKLKKIPPVMDVNGPVNIDYPKFNSTYFAGGAGLSSTLYDYAIFLQMLLNGGQYHGQRILSRHSVRMMTTHQIGDTPYGDNELGLAFSLTTKRGSAKSPISEGSFAWGGAFATSYWVDPKEKIVALVFKQVFNDPYYETNEKFGVMLYSAMTD